MKQKILPYLAALLFMLSSPSYADKTYSIPVDKPLKLKSLLDHEVNIHSSQLIESLKIENYVISSVDLDGNRSTIEAILYSNLSEDDKSAFLDNDNDGLIDVVAHRKNGKFHYHKKENIRTFKQAFDMAREDGNLIKFIGSLDVPMHKPDDADPLSSSPITYSSSDLRMPAKAKVNGYMISFIGDIARPWGMHAESSSGKSIVVYYDIDNDSLADFIARSEDSGATFTFELPSSDDLKDIHSIYMKYKL